LRERVDRIAVDADERHDKNDGRDERRNIYYDRANRTVIDDTVSNGNGINRDDSTDIGNERNIDDPNDRASEHNERGGCRLSHVAIANEIAVEEAKQTAIMRVLELM